jgi:ADP-ribose pyrophosphatase YjhB (NUDIX family)
MKSPNHRLFHVSGKAVIFNPEKTKIILLHNSGGWWTIPGGHIEGDETLEEAVRREVREETGVDYAGELRLAYA